MSELLPVVVEQPRDLIVCFGFDLAKRRRQPWHVAHGLAQGLAAQGRLVTIATDVAAEDDRSADYIVHGCGRLMQRGRPTPALRRFAEALAPARIYILTGTAALARMARLDLGAPTELIVASPPCGCARSWPGAARALARAAADAPAARQCPAAGLPGQGRLSPLRGGAADLSERGRPRALRAIGLPPGPVLRPQVEAPPIMLRPRLLAPEAVPVVAYLGPPWRCAARIWRSAPSRPPWPAASTPGSCSCCGRTCRRR
ncbi:MAG: hypothetical protein R3D28_12800 [Geminicoccaceae bacterium]